jgi:hypothetical protein
MSPYSFDIEDRITSVEIVIRIWARQEVSAANHIAESCPYQIGVDRQPKIWGILEAVDQFRDVNTREIQSQ